MGASHLLQTAAKSRHYIEEREYRFELWTACAFTRLRQLRESTCLVVALRTDGRVGSA
ncbi:hypothetical protein BN2476_360034 [Paraburkholderia piptadeniae]|uniref:Uncharacterized protein n=1 Tax=Paraburkholderia piptadeniae TaxID=1701573 RepID=A0A1N7S954_9BURK|nr:hypothetical protein BN2476_360034 [Paraburkholderia piptadeniae]